jgi:pimeloyl-ACP methyl ester carboxylesterase
MVRRPSSTTACEAIFFAQRASGADCQKVFKRSRSYGESRHRRTEDEMSRIKTGHCDVNGARIYYELRGNGPAVLFISGATGDAGHYTAVADALADEFTIVTYDRRGNSRSPRPPGWARTSMEEQADDAAALLKALGLRAAVFGNSGGAIIACSMLLRHAECLRGAILHEPPLAAVVSDSATGVGELKAAIEEAMARGGLPAAVEAFVRPAAGPAFDAIPHDTLTRMMGNGETLFGMELERFLTYRPDEEALARVRLPVRVLVGEQTSPLFQGAANWLAERLRTKVTALTGAHAPYFDRPDAMARALRPLLREVQ